MSVTFGEIHQSELAASASRARSRSALAQSIRVGTTALLILAPLWFGATSVVDGIVLVAACWLLFLLWLAEGIRAGELTFTSRPVLLPALLVLALTAVHWVMGISANLPATQLEWMRWAGYLALALVAGESFITPRRLRRLAAAVAVAGTAIAIFGIVQHLTGDGKIYWMVEPSQGGWIFGPYVNRNHFAGLMELWIPVALGLALVPDNSFTGRWLWCGAALVMAAAVVLSASRGGLLAVGVEVAALSVAAAALRGRRRAVVGLLVSVALVAGLVWFLGGTQMVERLNSTIQPSSDIAEEATGYRLELWKGTLEIFQQNVLIGSGLDTFATHFRTVKSFYTDAVWRYGHNAFLQFAAETGVVGLGLGIWLIVAAVRGISGNLRRTRHTASGAILTGMACGCLGFMVHGWLDFNFHVPANAANFVVLAAIVSRRGWDED